MYGWFELWLSRCRAEGVGVGGVRCRGVGVCRCLWVYGRFEFLLSRFMVEGVRGLGRKV
jgi:hypothetical protein